MIKNIVFDLGNVLISFRPTEYLDRINYPEKIKSRIISDIFESSEWKMLDNGDISTPEAIDSIASKSLIKRAEIERIFDLRTDLMFPLDQNVKVLPGLKKMGYSLYYLSNFPVDIFEKIKTENIFFRYFTSGIISAEVKFSKPDSRIYQILLGKNSLIPSECLFIDDLEINVRAAEKIGMKGLITYGSKDISISLAEALNVVIL